MLGSVIKRFDVLNPCMYLPSLTYTPPGRVQSRIPSIWYIAAPY